MDWTLIVFTGIKKKCEKCVELEISFFCSDYVLRSCLVLFSCMKVNYVRERLRERERERMVIDLLFVWGEGL